MVKTVIDQAKLIGGKKKNGHSDDCKCHICQNMMKKAERGEYTKEDKMKQFRKKGLIKKKNGHAPDCNCPICKNMMNKKKQKEADKADDSSEEDFLDREKKQEGGRKNKNNKKKSNGHKANCKCPICKNMKKGGGDTDSDSDTSIVNKKNMSQIENTIGETKTDTDTSSDSDTDLSDIPSVSDDSDSHTTDDAPGPPPQQAGTRKRRAIKSNSHKVNCKCPICKNMKKGRKTRRQKKRNSKRRF